MKRAYQVLLAGGMKGGDGASWPGRVHPQAAQADVLPWVDVMACSFAEAVLTVASGSRYEEDYTAWVRLVASSGVAVHMYRVRVRTQVTHYAELVHE